MGHGTRAMVREGAYLDTNLEPMGSDVCTRTFPSKARLCNFEMSDKFLINFSNFSLFLARLPTSPTPRYIGLSCIADDETVVSMVILGSSFWLLFLLEPPYMAGQPAPGNKSKHIVAPFVSCTCICADVCTKCRGTKQGDPSPESTIGSVSMYIEKYVCT